MTPDKNNSIKIEEHHFGDYVVSVFLDRTSRLFWENRNDEQSPSIASIRDLIARRAGVR